MALASKTRGDEFVISTRSEDDGKQRDSASVKISGFMVDSPGVLSRSEEQINHEQAQESKQAQATDEPQPKTKEKAA